MDRGRKASIFIGAVYLQRVRSYRKASCGHFAKGAVHLQRIVGSKCKGGV